MVINNKSVQGVSAYETPSVIALEVMSEGVLCASGGFDIADWDNDDESLDF